MAERKLRFGVMCYGTALAAWEAECVRQLMAVPGVEPALLITEKKPAGAPAPASSSPLKKVRSLLRSEKPLWVIYQRFFAEGKIRALEPVDCSAILGGLPRMDCEVIRKGKFSEYFREEDLEAIRSQGLAFMLRFAFGIIRGEILKAAEFGVWSFHHDDEEKYRGGPPSFWEIYNGDAETGVILQRLTDRLDGGIVLKRGRFPTARSWAENRDRGLFGGAGWPAEVCRDIFAGQADYLAMPPSRSTAPIYVAPTNWEMARFACMQAGRKAFGGGRWQKAHSQKAQG
jgi:hypothetical protein